MSAHGRESNQEFETALARALSRKLRPSGKYCPSSETIATYFEGSLTPDEAERCELHFSTCAGCQHEIGALVRMEISGARPENEFLSEPTWTRARTAALAGTVLLAGLGLTITIRFLPVGKLPGPASSTPSPVVELAIDIPPVSGATASPPEGRPSEAGAAPEPSPELLSEQSGASSPSQAAVAPPEEPSPVPLPTATVQVTSEKPLPHPTLSRRPAPPPEPLALARAPARKRDLILPLNAAPTPGLRPPTATVSVYPATPSPSSPPEEVKLLAPTPPLPRLPQQPSGALAALGRLLSGQVLSPQSARRTVIVLAPGKSSVSWRIGSGGRIERSRDSGRTWKVLASGVDVDLLAGAAPSESVCWLVGRSGVILKTTDGEQWERVPPPTTRDLLRILAKSAMAASVVAEGGDTFVTSDGGRSWERK